MFPGTFDPLTTAHLAIADAVRAELAVDEVALVLSLDPIGKRARSTVPERLAAIEARRDDRPWLAARTTDRRLVADIADGYDVVVLGADKWVQLHDPSFYRSQAAMEDALRRLPTVALAPRSGVPLPPDLPVHVLGVPEEYHAVSSTAVRSGRAEWRA